LDFSEKNSVITKSEKISDDLTVDIKDNNTVNVTYGKAYLIEQLTLNNKHTLSTVLQKDETNAWVAMNCIHPSKEKIQKQFQEFPKVNTSSHLANTPLYIIIVVYSMLLGYIIREMAIYKRPIILESSDWNIILLVTVIIIIVEFFIMYYIRTQKIHASKFQMHREPGTETYFMYIEGQQKTIIATVYQGRFYNDDMPNKELFGFSAGEIEGGLKHNGKFYVDLIKSAKSELWELEDELAHKYVNLEEKKIEATTNQVVALSFGTKTDSEIEQSKKTDTIIAAKIEEIEAEFLEIESKLLPRIEELRTYINEMTTKYNKELEKILDEKLDEKRKEEILHADETINVLKNKIAKAKLTEIRLNRNVQGLYDENATASDQFNERVYDSLSNKMKMHREIIDNTYSNGNGKTYYGDEHESGISSRDLLTIAKPFVWVISVVGVLFAFIWGIREIATAISHLNPWTIGTVFIAFFLSWVIVGGLITKIISKWQKWSNNADTTVLER
jgi:hypothetical protein